MKRVLSWVLASVLGFATFYVVYAHVAAILTAKRYREVPDIESFTSESELARDWTIRTEGDLRYAIEGGELHVTGSGTLLELASEPRSLEEARITLRFKVESKGAYDVLLALEGGEHRISYGLRNEEAAPGYAWDGDPLHVMPGIRGRGLPGEELEEKGRHPFAMDGEWHEITLAVSTTLHRIAAFVDGVPTGTVLAEWIGGMPVRVVFGVRAREPDQPIDVAFGKVVYEPRPPEAQSLDFTDRFDGKVIDPRHWAVHSFSSDLLRVALKPTPHGLRATGEATPLIAQPAPAFMIDTPSFPLSSVYLRTIVEARDLHRAAFFVGITSALGGPHLRFFDVGFHGDERASTVAGHWGRDAQVRFEGSDYRAASDVVTLEIELDAKTRLARAKMDGRVIGEHVSDLQPREHVRVRFGVVLDDAEGHFDITVRELRLRALGD